LALKIIFAGQLGVFHRKVRSERLFPPDLPLRPNPVPSEGNQTGCELDGSAAESQASILMEERPRGGSHRVGNLGTVLRCKIAASVALTIASQKN
jgi:hypothetical protein